MVEVNLCKRTYEPGNGPRIKQTNIKQIEQVEKNWTSIKKENWTSIKKFNKYSKKNSNLWKGTYEPGNGPRLKQTNTKKIEQV